MSTDANALVRPPASKPARYLRDHRFKITLWTAAIEGLLVFVHVIPHLAMYVLVVVAVAFWATAARGFKSQFARNLAWIFAASQALAVLIPIGLFFVKWIAILAIAIIAVVALVILFAERPHS